MREKYKRTASDVESEGLRVFGNYKWGVSDGSYWHQIASTKGRRKFRPNDTPTPCMQCKYLCYSITSILPSGGEWPVMPSCMVKVKAEDDVPAELDVWRPAARRCPDFEMRAEEGA